MIAHVLLFRPAADLQPDDRDALIAAFERALNDIPLIRRAHVGRRLLLGRQYEAVMRDEYPFFAMLEFDSETDLRAYLDHPAHDALAQRFFQSMDAALVYDFALMDVRELRPLLR